MLKQLEIESVQADLEAVRSRLAARTKRQDPIGFRQFTARAAELEGRLANLMEDAARPHGNREVALFFGGTPVLGSRGIDADFASRALGSFQDLISAKFASREGPVGARGRIRGRDRTHLLISDVARGSFGFVLEQANVDEADDTGLGDTIENVVDFIQMAYSNNEKAFELAASDLDRRLLNTIQNFFRLLHSSGATLKVVSNSHQYLLQHEDILRARTRVDRVTATDEVRPFTGRLLFIPSSRRFDLFMGAGGVVSGTIANSIITEIMTEAGMPRQGIADTWCVVELRVRTVIVRGHSPTFSYQLVRIISSGGLTPPSTLG